MNELVQILKNTRQLAKNKSAGILFFEEKLTKSAKQFHLFNDAEAASPGDLFAGRQGHLQETSCFQFS